MVPEGRSGGQWSFPRSVLCPVSPVSWHSESGQHCLETQYVQGERMGSHRAKTSGRGDGMRAVQQVEGRAHSGCQAQTDNNSVIKSWDIIYHAGPFLQT